MPVTSIMQLLHAFFSARGNIVRIDSCTDDSIRISLTVAIRLIGAPVNRYTPSGDNVYYKRNSSKEWHGPATVLGRDAQQYLLKHGGIYVRVHPCHLQLAESESQLDSNLTSTESESFPSNPQKIISPSSDSEEEETPSNVSGPPSPMSPPATPAHLLALQPHPTPPPVPPDLIADSPAPPFAASPPFPPYRESL